MSDDLGYQVLHYQGNPKLKRANVNIQYTQEQIKEYIKCSNDPLYFIENYVKIVSLDEGFVPFAMYPYQRRMVKTFSENRFVICKLPRQSGKTTTVGAFILHEILFKELQTVGILANKGSLAREILERIKNSYEALPFWLQQGITEWNKGTIELENGSRVIASSTSSSAVRGNSYTHLMLDEYAFVPTNIADDFMRSVYPTISSGKNSKVFIVSTPHGMNHFYKMWVDAQEKRSNYVPIEINWNDVPGRDESWKQEQIKNIGIKSWNQEFEGRFLGSSNTLIDADKLSSMVFIEPIDIKDNFRIYEKPVPGKTYTITVDTAHGLGEDSSVFVVTDVTKIPYKVVGVFQDNKIQPIYYPSLIRNTAIYYNNAHVLVEINDIGSTIAHTLWEELEYENMLMVTRGGRGGQRLGPGKSVNNQLGFKTTGASKRVALSNLKMLIELDKFIVNDFHLLEELTTFVRNRKNSFEADKGKHDDIVMASALFAWMTTQEYFKDLLDQDIRKNIQQDLIAQSQNPELNPHKQNLQSYSDGNKEDIDEDVFFGFIDVGVDNSISQSSFTDNEGTRWTFTSKDGF